MAPATGKEMILQGMMQKMIGMLPPGITDQIEKIAVVFKEYDARMARMETKQDEILQHLRGGHGAGGLELIDGTRDAGDHLAGTGADTATGE